MEQETRTLQQFNGARVLLVEDELINQLVCKQALQKMSIEVVVVEDGQQAVDAVRDERFDLILMDCQMPVMDGYTAARNIREHEKSGELPRLPIIAITAHAMSGDKEACIAAGMDDYLSKPFEIDDLQAVLQKWLPGSP